jgi:hypothetical protein
MKEVLRLIIQAAWAFVGLFAVWMAATILWHILSVVFAGDLFDQGLLALFCRTCALVLGLGLLGALIYGAWAAVFRFSPSILGPTCGLVSLVLLKFANDTDRFFTDSFVNPRLGMHPAMPLLGLALAIVTWGGWIAFFRAMPKVLAKLLYPDLPPATRASL